jgi:hypothetical protein
LAALLINHKKISVSKITFGSEVHIGSSVADLMFMRPYSEGDFGALYGATEIVLYNCESIFFSNHY